MKSQLEPAKNLRDGPAHLAAHYGGQVAMEILLESSEQCEYYSALAQIMTLVEAQRYQPGELIVCEEAA